MPTPVELPSGKILDLARFIALLPVESTPERSYDLILEGHSFPISLEKNDAETLKKLLQSDLKILLNESSNDSIISLKEGWNKDEQLQKNQLALKLLQKRMERNKNMSDEEAMRREEFLDNFKQIIDEERLPGQKLYS